jgi:hypothetical protein
LIKCQVDKMGSWQIKCCKKQNAKLTRGQVDEIVKSTVDEMTQQQQQLDEKTYWLKGKMTKCLFHKKGKLMKWENDKMPSCWNGKLAKCKVDQMSRSINLQVSELTDWGNGKLTKW